ncbi:MAG TPA: CAP domain-containing protein, partial [Candidatus Limnocylindrales bacterium]|nr:CAP domain-containing protein [Candidatus Limnocylindrales bacterium]
FTETMDRASTKAAFSVTIGGKAVAGSVSFAEKSTVLVFKPKGAYPYGAKIRISVAATALSASGAPLAKAAAVQVTVKAKPKPAASAPTARTGSGGGSGGGSVGGGSWGAVEVYYMKLMNCTRTGGWVTSSGGCSSPGGRNVAPLKLDAGISSKVARPYARKLAVGNACSHFIGGGPDDRLRAAGYTNYTWAENIGCRSGNAYDAVLGSHLFFQSEKSYNGGHYVNLMNAKYDRAGVGVWVYSGRVRLVVDFYHP